MNTLQWNSSDRSNCNFSVSSPSSSAIGKRKRQDELEDDDDEVIITNLGNNKKKKLEPVRNKRKLDLTDDQLVDNVCDNKKRRLMANDASPSTSSSGQSQTRNEDQENDALTDDDDEEVDETDSFGAALQMADLVVNNIRTNKPKVPAPTTSKSPLNEQQSSPVVARPKALNQKPILAKLIDHTNRYSFYRQLDGDKTNLALKKQMLYTQLANATTSEEKEDIEIEIEIVDEESAEKNRFVPAKKLSFQQMQLERETLKQNQEKQQIRNQKETDSQRERRWQREKQERREQKKVTENDQLDDFCSRRKPTKPVAMKGFSLTKILRKDVLEKQLRQDKERFGGWQKVEYFPGHFMWMKKTNKKTCCDSPTKCHSIWHTKGAL